MSSRKDKSQGKARGKAQPALPGLEPPVQEQQVWAKSVSPKPGTSSAWEKMKSTPKRKHGERTKIHRTEAGPGHPSWRHVLPGKCTCKDVLFEDKDHPEGVKRNPWTMGHFYWCSMWLAKCDDCGLSGGTHTHTCSFWKLHPNIAPF